MCYCYFQYWLGSSLRSLSLGPPYTSDAPAPKLLPSATYPPCRRHLPLWPLIHSHLWIKIRRQWLITRTILSLGPCSIVQLSWTETTPMNRNLLKVIQQIVQFYTILWRHFLCQEIIQFILTSIVAGLRVGIFWEDCGWIWWVWRIGILFGRGTEEVRRRLERKGDYSYIVLPISLV